MEWILSDAADAVRGALAGGNIWEAEMNLLLNFMTQPRPLIQRLLLAVVLVAGGLGLRFAMGLESGMVPFVTFYPVIAVASLIPGVAPGVLSLALTLGVCWFVVLPPIYSFAIEAWSDLAGLLVFAAMGLAFQVGGAALKSVFIQLARERDEFSANAELREILLRALRYCIGHYLRGMSIDMQNKRDLAAASICRETIDESIARLDALERLYRRLYASEEFGTGSAGLFIEDICRDLVTVAAIAQVRCNVSAEAIWLAADHRISLGLMVAELVTDALERTPETGSSIDVVLRPVESGRVSLRVRDAGGRTPSVDRSEVCKHIPALTRALTRHLGGTVESFAGEDGSVTVMVVLACSDASERAASEFWGANDRPSRSDREVAGAVGAERRWVRDRQRRPPSRSAVL